jgi:Flp pilus assembly secretin CpaC
MTGRKRFPAAYSAAYLAVISALGFVAADRVLATELPLVHSDRAPPGMYVISSDVTSRFVPLGLNKAVVVEMPGDVKDVLVSNPEIVNVVMRTNRRAYIMGKALGETNVFLFDAQGRQLGALDIGVAPIPQLDPPPLLENSALPAQAIIVYRGAEDVRFYRCTPTCSTPPKPKEDEAPPTTNSAANTVFRGPTGLVTGSQATTGVTYTGR